MADRLRTTYPCGRIPSAGSDSNGLLPTGGGACYQVHYRRAAKAIGKITSTNS